MMKHCGFIVLLVMTCLNLYSQDVFRYHKSSIYSIMLKHENQEYCDELVSCFNKIPIPEKFNNHNLSVRVFKAGILEESDTTSAANQKSHIDALLKKNAVGRRLVAKWFNYSKSGSFDPQLILERGFYNVTAEDVAMQAKSYRTQTGVLFDAGQELIGHTYVLVNDIRYGDKRSSREKKMSVAIGLGTVLSAAVPIIGQYAMAGVATLANDYSGFNVTVTSYLYRLKWDKEVENGFYQLYYTNPDVVKRQTFAKDKESFSLEYVGDYTVHSSNSNFKGINGREEQIRKVCTRAIDKAIAQLQKQHPQFRVRTPLFSVSPITAQIGLREDVDENSKYEVLEVGETEDGKTTYKRVAVIKPKKNAIWDNRYLAEFEDDYNAALKATEFEIVSGSIPHEGLLIREID